MLYVYAIIIAGREQSPDVETLAHGGVAAAFRRHAEQGLPPTAESVAAHARVVESLWSRGPVLPARFGTTVPDDASLRASLARHHDALAAALERVRGCVELGVRAIWSTPTPAPPRDAALTGRAYMLARADQERRRQAQRREADEAVARIHPPLAELARDAVCSVLPKPQTPMIGAYLVPRDGVDHFTRRVARLDAEHRPRLALVCTGPWPPYSFAPALGGKEAARV